MYAAEVVFFDEVPQHDSKPIEDAVVLQSNRRYRDDLSVDPLGLELLCERPNDVLFLGHPVAWRSGRRK